MHLACTGDYSVSSYTPAKATNLHPMHPACPGDLSVSSYTNLWPETERTAGQAGRDFEGSGGARVPLARSRKDRRASRTGLGRVFWGSGVLARNRKDRRASRAGFWGALRDFACDAAQCTRLARVYFPIRAKPRKTIPDPKKLTTAPPNAPGLPG
jgi:hypothetical protein